MLGMSTTHGGGGRGGARRGLLALVALGALACAGRPSPGVDVASFEDVRRIVAALDDVAGEYPQAVVDGAVRDPIRMRVTERLVQDARRYAGHLTDADRAPLTRLALAIERRDAPAAVVAAARRLRAEILARRRLVLAPATPPSRARAQALWRVLCVGCHGETGGGDGPQGLYLEPEPKNFQDPEFMADLAPSRSFSRITDGMPGTAMPSWGIPTASERWGLAALVSTFRFDADQVERGRGLAPRAGAIGAWTRLTDRSDASLLAALTARGLSASEAEDVLAYWRTEVAFAPIGGRFATVRAALARGLERYQARDWAAAAASLTEARRRGVVAVEAIAAGDRRLAARLTEQLVRVERAGAAGAIEELVAHEVVRTQALLDDAEVVTATAFDRWRRAVELAAAAIVALALVALTGAGRRRTAAAVGAGGAVGTGAAALAGALGVPEVALAAAAVAIVAAPRVGAAWDGPAGVAALAAAVAAVVVDAATPVDAAVVLGVTGLGAVGLAGRSKASGLAHLATAVTVLAAAAIASRAGWLWFTRHGDLTGQSAAPRVDALGLYPATVALGAGAAVAIVAAAVAGAAARRVTSPAAGAPRR